MSVRVKRAVVSAFLLAVLAAALPAGAAVRTVPSSKYPTIQSAIAAARAGDKVVVSAGTYRENINFLGKNITVASASGALDAAGNALTVVDGGGLDSVVTFASAETAEAVLEGFVITNGRGRNLNPPSGYPYYFGGGIVVLSASPTIRNCVVRGNTANQGAGIYLESSSSVVSACRFDANVATQADNGSSGVGGGARVLSGGARFEGCIFSGNTADAGGGAYFSETLQSGSTMTNCIAADNTVKYHGGGLFFHYSAVMLHNCTIAGNVAQTGQGGGVWSRYSTSQRFYNTIVYANRALQLPQYNQFYTEVVTPVLHNCDVEGGYSIGTGNFDLDPLFVPGGSGLSASPYSLQRTSPCVDTADPAYAPATDIAGLPRTQDGDGNGTALPDIGSYELEAAPSLQIGTALYDYVLDSLFVQATSPSGATAALELLTDGVSRGPMAWDGALLLWHASATLPSPPSVITVCGVDGCSSVQ